MKKKLLTTTLIGIIGLSSLAGEITGLPIKIDSSFHPKRAEVAKYLNESYSAHLKAEKDALLDKNLPVGKLETKLGEAYHELCLRWKASIYDLVEAIDLSKNLEEKSEEKSRLIDKVRNSNEDYCEKVTYCRKAGAISEEQEKKFIREYNALYMPSPEKTK